MKEKINFISTLSLLKTRSLICVLPLLLAIQACKKNYEKPEQNNDDNSPSGNLILTLIDRQTQKPLNNTSVYIAYGNTFSEYKVTGVDGKVSFSIPNGWVLNEIKVAKQGYCTYWTYPNTISFVQNQTIYLDHYAYLRFHVKNVTPAFTSDKLVIYSPHPNSYQGYEFNFYGIVDSTFITESLAGNLGISCNIFTGSTFVSSFNAYVNAIGDDTVDVTVNY